MKNQLKRLICLLMILCMGVVVIPSVAEETAVTPAWNVINNITLGWNLGNSLDASNSHKLGGEKLNSETCWGNPKTTPELIDLVVDSGFDIIRVPVTWFNHMNEENQVDPAWMDRVQEVVDYVMNTGVYCILNVHHDTGEKGWLKASDVDLDVKKARFTALWEQIAERFGNYGDHLIFEGFNEILNDKNSWSGNDPRALAITNELNQIFVDTVRASGMNNTGRVLMLNTYCAGGGSDVTFRFTMPEDTAEGCLIVSAHVYQPWSFVDGNQRKVKTWTKSPIDTALGNMHRSFVAKGIPVIIGEFGAEDKGNMDQIISWADYYLKKASSLNLRCVWWDNGVLFKLFSRRTNTVTNEPLIRTMLAACKGETYAPETNEAPAADEKDLKAGRELCADADQWTAWIDAGAGAKATMSYNAAGFTAQVEKSGADAWLVQPAYRGLALEEGKTYRLSFDCTADKEIITSVYLQRNYGSYASYAGVDYLAQTDGTVHLETEFTQTEATDSNVALVFNLGGHIGMEPYSVTVTNVHLTEMQ